MDHRSEVEKKSSEPAPKSAQKRRFLGAALKLGAAALGLSILEGTGISKAASVLAADEDTLAPHQATEPPKPKEGVANAPRESNLEGLRVFFGPDDLPTHYITPGGAEVRLDRDTLSKAREAAIKNNEVEFVTILPRESAAAETVEPTLEHPVIGERPTNALNEEQLKKRGISITQSPEVEFFIRSPAFEEGGIFETFTEDGPRKLKIVLVDGPVAAAPFLQDPQYDGVRAYLEDTAFLKNDEFLQPGFADRYREKQEKMLASLRTQLEQGNGTREYTLSMIQAAKELLFKLDHLKGPELMKFLAEKTTGRSGLYIPPYDPETPHSFKYPEKSKQEPGTAVLFIAAGDSVQPAEEVKMFFDGNGKFQVKSEKNLHRKSYLPTEKDSMPDPDRYKPDFEANPMDPNSYPYGAQDVIAIIYHEGEHDVMIGAALHKGDLADTSEYQTDMGFIKRLRAVRKRWVESGFTDDSLSSFGFRLRNGKYIIFRRNAPGTNTA